MKVPLAYLAVVIIWSTTPLGIVWSSESVEPTLAVLLRMVIAWLIGLVILIVSTVRVPWHGQALKLYIYSAIGIFGGMSLSYAAARTLPSGLMSLIFGLAPLISGLLAQKLNDEPAFTLGKKLGLVTAFVGLGIVCLDSLNLQGQAVYGIAYILLAVFFFSLSGVMVKRITLTINPVATTFGALTFSTPLFFIVWWLFGGQVNYEQWQPRAIASIVYLGIFGSMIGFVAYFYVLQKLTASTVALVTMLTPVFALALGAWLNNEPLTVKLLVGAVFVITGLTCFQWSSKVESLLNRKESTCKNQKEKRQRAA